MRSLVVHAGDFADELRNEGRAKFWCDQTPWNLLIAQDLTELLPDAIFVLMLRDYRGAILSLRRSFAEGYEWAGKTVRESALVWADSYKHVPELPMERTVVVSYDRLCLSPEESIASLERELAVRLGVSDAGFDRTVFTRRHASSNMERQTIGSPDGYGALAPIEPFDATRWSDGMESASAPYVGATQALLKERFGEAYVSAGLGGS